MKVSVSWGGETIFIPLQGESEEAITVSWLFDKVITYILRDAMDCLRTLRINLTLTLGITDQGEGGGLQRAFPGTLAHNLHPARDLDAV